ncbi:Spy/CpxP family protein refolding chaperone [Flavobacterium daejeonense]|uniref:Spy/CpxP family protein refolding chaperone n=1 Tax=Flavobacterium daejeonense TaxID=350893 RepID=UPI00068D7400|nr:Spy/CpxP family protein refolding chaperone [Flavobacterium daejeonense]
MKKLIIAALLVVSVSTFAQEKQERSQRGDMRNMTPEQRAERRVERMTKDLNLDAKQQEQLKQMYANEAKEREAMMADMKNKKDKSKEKAGDQRKGMQDRMKASEEKMKTILTPEQFTKWKSNQDKMRERMQQRMSERQGGMGMDDNGPRGGGDMDN